VTVKNNVVLGARLLFGFVRGVEAPAGVGVREALDIGIILAVDGHTSGKTEDCGELGNGRVWPYDSGAGRSEGRWSGRDQVRGD
jgi:hypothetical protein